MPKPVGLMLLTFSRLPYAAETLLSFFSYLHSARDIHLHIADDGSPDGYVDEVLLAAFGGVTPVFPGGGQLVGISRTDSQRRGYGASYNLATQVLHVLCDEVCVAEDDWALQREFNLNLFLEGLEADERIDSIRMGYIGYTQELRGHFISAANKQWLLLDGDSPERHVNAGHPRLERVSYQRRVGPWAEGLEPGATEFDWCGRPEARQGVVWPVDLIHPSGDLFAHTGTLKAEEMMALMEKPDPQRVLAS